MTKHYIVAIGGSAGALQPLYAFFDQRPLEEASYIIIRHFPNNSQSELKQLLEYHRKLKVLDACEGMVIQPIPFM
jgi:chemotaxis response regulator CheB